MASFDATVSLAAVRPFLTGFLLGMSLCVDLGMVNVALMRTAILSGFRAAFAFGVGSTLGDLVYAVLSATGATAAMRHPMVRNVVWIAGTSILLWLSWRMIREAIHAHTIDATKGDDGSARRSLGGHFAFGAAIALSSPSAILWFATAGAVLIATSTAGSGWAGQVRFFSGFATASVLWSAFLGFLTAKLHGRLGAQLTRALALISAVIFLVLAAKVFVDGRPEGWLR